jgi:aminobenzoyl-glutamate utilization protein B
MTLSGIEFFQRPELLKEAKRELDRRRGEGFIYEALLGDREPPLDYRE